MTGQGGGIHEARARFSAEVETALTRARRAASEARAQSGEFRRATEALAEQAKTGRLRGVHRDEVELTTAQARAEAAKFRNANGLPVEEYPAAESLIARLPAPEPKPVPEDEDFSQRQILLDDEFEETPTDPAPTHPEPTGPEYDAAADTGIGQGVDRGIDRGIDTGIGQGIDAGIDTGIDTVFDRVPESGRTGDTPVSDADEEDFSQQRILIDATAETYRPDSLTVGLFDHSDRDNRS